MTTTDEEARAQQREWLRTEIRQLSPPIAWELQEKSEVRLVLNGLGHVEIAP